MPTVAIVALVVVTVLTLGVLAVALVVVTDRLHGTVHHLLGVRDRVLPVARELQENAERAAAHAQRQRRARLRAGDGSTTER